jgi:hypothetical protein
MVRKRPKTPTRIERKQNYILKKYHILKKKIDDNNLNLYVDVTDEDILKQINLDKLDSVKHKILFLTRLANEYLT